MATSVSDWQSRAAEKRLRCEEAIPKAWKLPADVLEQLQKPLESSKNNLIALDIPRRSGILTEKELQITETFDVSTLLKKLAAGDLSALEVTVAFSKRAAIAQQVTCCLTETFFEEAQERARRLDERRERGEPLGPLHGLPISLKDPFQVIGTQATIGLVAYLDRISTTNAALVDILLELGAVLYVKTNVPQTMMTADSHNYVFGRTLNPWNTMLGAGGSSGGEGALVAFRGSPLGVGTDIAGSIRIPALCCGTYGFKPTASRIPYGGQQGCANPEACGIFVKAVIDAQPALYDSTALDIPWRSVEIAPKTKLRFGVLAEDSVFPLHPPVKKALAEAVQRLREQGHEIVQLLPEEGQVAEATKVSWRLFGLDNTASRVVASGGEPPIPSRLAIDSQVESLGWMADPAYNALDGLGKLAASNLARAAIIDSWRKVWGQHKIDAVIAPSAQNTAVEHDAYGLPPYTNFVNLLDYPSCVIPYMKASDVPSSELFEVKPGQVAPPYNPEVLNDAPCSVQVFTSRMRDEECLAVAKIVVDCLK
ncbi:Fatty-acid amide hydrolase [Pleurostoma richardsiae]|uniref:amidase n=1 Tax=Pleurostoma richardsiae TaxID=41990 RepID=A0AA38RDY5_9PEZI|nr:Fatty-acid amide hydrolase [Pleurostoma richardsiae]